MTTTEIKDLIKAGHELKRFCRKGKNKWINSYSINGNKITEQQFFEAERELDDLLVFKHECHSYTNSFYLREIFDFSGIKTFESFYLLPLVLRSHENYSKSEVHSGNRNIVFEFSTKLSKNEKLLLLNVINGDAILPVNFYLNVEETNDIFQEPCTFVKGFNSIQTNLGTIVLSFNSNIYYRKNDEEITSTNDLISDFILERLNKRLSDNNI